MIDRLLGFFSRLFSKLAFWNKPKPYSTIFVEDCLPDNLKLKTLYVVHENGAFEQAAMLCPCACGQILHMNLLQDERPCWKVTHHSDGTASLHPSVWRKKGCRSHFWFQRGNVQWCPPEISRN
jgi:hypothetical protein